MVIFHAIYCVIAPMQCYIVLSTIKRMMKGRIHKDENGTWLCIARTLLMFVIKYVFNPILVGLILYGEDIIGGKSGVRIAISTSIITTSYLFLGSISRFPCVGRYTNMLTKVQLESMITTIII